MAPRRRIQQEPVRQAVQLRASAPQGGGYVDITNTVRERRNLQVATDFSGLSKTFENIANSVSSFYEDRDERTAAKGGDLGSLLVEKMHGEGKEKPLSEAVKEHLTPEQQSIWASLGPNGQRQGAATIARGAAATAANTLVDVFAAAEKAPTFSDSGEPLPVKSLVADLATAREEINKKHDELYGEYPLIRSAVRQATQEVFNRYELDGVKVESEIRANAMQSHMTSEVVYLTKNLVNSSKGPKEVEDGFELILTHMFDSDSAKNLRTALGPGVAKKAIASSIQDVALQLTKSGYPDEAQDFIQRAFHHGNGNELAITNTEDMVRISQSVLALENNQEIVHNSIQRKFNSEQEQSALKNSLEAAIRENPKASTQEIYKVLVNKGYSEAEIQYVRGSPLGNFKVVDQLRSDIEESNAFPDVKTFSSEITDATTPTQLSDLSKRIPKHLPLKFQEYLVDRINKKERELNDRVERVSVKMLIATGAAQAAMEGDSSGVFNAQYADMASYVDAPTRATLGRELQDVITSMDAQSQAIIGDTTTTKLEKTVKLNEVASKSNAALHAVHSKVLTLKQAALTKTSQEFETVRSTIASKKNSEFPANAYDDVYAAYASKRRVDKNAAQDDLISAFGKDRRILSNAFRAPILENVGEILTSIRTQFQDKITFESRDEVLKEVFARPEFSHLSGIPFNNPDALMKFFYSDKFLSLLPTDLDGVRTQNGVDLNALKGAFKSAVNSYIYSGINVNDIKEASDGSAVGASANEEEPTIVEKLLAGTTNPPEETFQIAINREAGALRAAQVAEEGVPWKLLEDRVLRKSAYEVMPKPDTSYDLLTTDAVVWLENVERSLFGARNFLSPRDATVPLKYSDFSNDDVLAFNKAARESLTGSGNPANDGGTASTQSTFAQFIKGGKFIRKPGEERPADEPVGVGLFDGIKARELAGAQGVSMAPIHGAMLEILNVDKLSTRVALYSKIGVPTDTELSYLPSESRQKLAYTLMGSDWNGFKRMMETSERFIEDDPRFDILSDLTGLDIKESELVGNLPSETEVFLQYARYQHAMHRRWNGASTPKEFEISDAKPESRPTPESRPVSQFTLKAPSKEAVGVNYDDDEYIPFIKGINETQSEVKTGLGINENQFQEYAKLSAAIALQETKGGDDSIIRMKWGFIPVPAYITDKLGVGGSRGITQLSDDVMFGDAKVSAILKKVGIEKSNYDAWDPKTQAKATIAFLHAIKPAAEANLKKNPSNKQDMSMAEYIYYQYNKPSALVKGKAQGDNSAVKNVKRFFDAINAANK